MANKHYKEVQILADSELVEKLAETQLDLTKTRFDQTISGNVTPKEIRDAKKKYRKDQYRDQKQRSSSDD